MSMINVIEDFSTNVIFCGYPMSMSEGWGMKMWNRKMKSGGLLIVVLVVGFLGVIFFGNSGRDGPVAEEGQTNLLARPVFAQSISDNITFLDEEAGISIYANVGPVDLSQAKTAYRTIENETSDYIIGSLPLPNLASSEDVHCFVHKDGWVAVYYLKSEPLSKIVDWQYWVGGTLTKNKLQIGLEVMSNATGTSVASAKYYHYGYSSANKFMIAIKTHYGNGLGNASIYIPNEFTIHERSWSHYAERTLGWPYYFDSYFRIDGITINTIAGNLVGPVTVIGQLNSSQLSSGTYHDFSVYTYSDATLYGTYGVAIGLVYAE